MTIQQVYIGSHEEHLRKKIHRGEMKFDQYLPLKLKSPKFFEVDDQINPILQVFDESTDMHLEQEKGKQFWWPSKWVVFENLGCLRFASLNVVNVFFYRFLCRLN